MSSLSVSFIIVNKDGKEFLSGILDSIEALDFPPEAREVWVVDNASNDGSVSWLEERYPQVRLIRNTKNEGFARPNNQAALQAEGEWLALVNNDMRLDPAWLKRLLASIGEKRVCAGSRILRWDGRRIDFDGGGLAFSGHGLQPGYGERPRLVESGPTLFACGGAMLIRRDVFLELGGFDDDFFAYLEDVDLGWRLWLKGYEVVHVPAAIAYHHHNGTSRNAPSFQKKLLMERNALALLIKNLEEEAFYRVLSAALLLGTKRFLAESGLDRTPFRFSLPEKASKSSPRKKLWNALTKKGVAFLCQRLRQELSRQRKEGLEPMMLAGLVGWEEIIDSLPRWMEKRSAIQTQRQRSDEELFHLFRNPLQPLQGSDDYLMAHNALVKAWQLWEYYTPKGR